jgi:hypothetical protein
MIGFELPVRAGRLGYADLNQPAFISEYSELHTVWQVQLGEETGSVGLHQGLAQVELRRDSAFDLGTANHQPHEVAAQAAADEQAPEDPAASQHRPGQRRTNPKEPFLSETALRKTAPFAAPDWSRRPPGSAPDQPSRWVAILLRCCASACSPRFVTGARNHYSVRNATRKSNSGG